MYRNIESKDVIAGAVVSAALTTAAHVGLWHCQGEVPLTARYAVGTTCVMAGVSCVLDRLGLRRLILPLWSVAAFAGLPPVFGHLVRRQRPDALSSALEESEANAIWFPRTRRVR